MSQLTEKQGRYPYSGVMSEPAKISPVALLLLLLASMAATVEAGAASAQSEQIRAQLIKHFQHWEGTPYRYGGNSYDGIDCSGFVYIMFERALAVCRTMPKSTARQGERPKIG